MPEKGCGEVTNGWVRRILHVTDCYAPRLGGIEVQVGDLVRVQSAAGHEVGVVTATPLDGEAHGQDPDGCTVHRLTSGLPFALPVRPGAAGHLARHFARWRPEVVHLHVGAVSPFAWSAARVAVAQGLPVVVSVHSIWDAGTRYAYRALAVIDDWRRWPVVIAPVSNAVAERVGSAGRGRALVTVVPNGLDLAAWRATVDRARPRGQDPAELRVVVVGRLAPRKRSVALVRILRSAADRLPPGVRLRAALIGDGPAEPLVRRALAHHGMTGWVQLAGRRPRNELPGWLATADVFLAPAIREAFGIAALEARTAGLAVVARRGTGIEDFVIDGRNGILAPDDDGLATAIARLAADPQLLGRLTCSNRAHPWSPADWSAVLARLDDCYAAAVAVAGGRGWRRDDGKGRRAGVLSEPMQRAR